MLEKCKRKIDGLPLPEGYEVDETALDYYRACERHASIEAGELVSCIEEIGRKPKLLKKAETITVRDFRWRWHHFRDSLELLECVKPGLPRRSRSEHRPISELQYPKLENALKHILKKEYSRRASHDPDPLPHPKDRREEIIYTATYDLHARPRERGHPAGFRWDDGTEYAYAKILELVEDALQAGRSYVLESIISEVMSEFRIISSDEHKTELDQDSVLVSSDGDEGKVRRRLRRLVKPGIEELKREYCVKS